MLCAHVVHLVKESMYKIVNLLKVKVTLVQALRLCTGLTAHRGSRGITLLFLDHGTRRGEGSASRPGCSLLPGKTHYPWMGPRAGLDRCGKSRPHQDSIPDRPARSHSLYRLSFPAHVNLLVLCKCHLQYFCTY